MDVDTEWKIAFNQITFSSGFSILCTLTYDATVVVTGSSFKLIFSNCQWCKKLSRTRSGNRYLRLINHRRRHRCYCCFAMSSDVHPFFDYFFLCLTILVLEFTVFFVHWVWFASYFRHSFRFGARRRKNFFRLSATSRWFAHGTEFKMYLFHTQLVWNFLAWSTVVEKKYAPNNYVAFTVLYVREKWWTKNRNEMKKMRTNSVTHKISKSLANNSVNLIYFRLHFFIATHIVCVLKKMAIAFEIWLW